MSKSSVLCGGWSVGDVGGGCMGWGSGVWSVGDVGGGCMGWGCGVWSVGVVWGVVHVCKVQVGVHGGYACGGYACCVMWCGIVLCTMEWEDCVDHIHTMSHTQTHTHTQQCTHPSTYQNTGDTSVLSPALYILISLRRMLSYNERSRLTGKSSPAVCLRGCVGVCGCLRVFVDVCGCLWVFVGRWDQQDVHIVVHV